VPQERQNIDQNLKGLPNMKLIVRVLALVVVVAGFAAASLSSSSTKLPVSSQSAAAHMPYPAHCAPGLNCTGKPQLPDLR
jgi:hypothetical protein